MKIYLLSEELTPFVTNNEERIISVFLRANGRIQNFRCLTCGRITFQYSGEVESIYDGAKIPEEKAVIDVLCRRCKIIYRVI